jgi:hypothetical protein
LSRYFIISTLKRGTVSPPERLDAENSLRCEDADYLFAESRKSAAERERDRLLTHAQWAKEEAFRAFLRRPPRIA